jgi:peptidoglycan/xylan/chitin deacetylase (PgdA/CDA1 family)
MAEPADESHDQDHTTAHVGASVVAVGSTRHPCAVMTYDDGPQPGDTEAVLGALSEFAATATFFMLVSRTRRYASLVDEVAAAGHEIGLHGLDHRRLTRLEPDVARRRIVDAKHELEDATGRAIRWFRPPYGSQSPATWTAVTDAGLTPVLWSAACMDWVEADDDERLAQVRGLRDSGAVILLHDGFAGRLDGVDDGAPPVIDRGKLSRSVLATCAAKGLRGCSMAEALQTGTPVHRTWLGDPAPDGMPHD